MAIKTIFEEMESPEESQPRKVTPQEVQMQQLRFYFGVYVFIAAVLGLAVVLAMQNIFVTIATCLGFALLFCFPRNNELNALRLALCIIALACASFNVVKVYQTPYATVPANELGVSDNIGDVATVFPSIQGAYIVVENGHDVVRKVHAVRVDDETHALMKQNTQLFMLRVSSVLAVGCSAFGMTACLVYAIRKHRRLHGDLPDETA